MAIKSNVLVSFQDDELTPDQTRGIFIGIVQWENDDKKFPPKLEKRAKYLDRSTGESRWDKCTGFDASDMKMIIENMDEIMDHLSLKAKAKPAKKSLKRGK